MFKDEVKICVKAGDGGCGCVSFRHEKFIPRGGPDGGDGGKGGDIVFRVVANCNNLLELSRKQRYYAKNGASGGGKLCTGKSGPPLVIEVPPGTIVRDDRQRELVDLKENGEEVIIAKGGKGGKGNARFASPTYQTPRKYTQGQPGEEKELYLELKLIADVGLVGFPNAGKSTLISRISAARPKIASYPFTTLEPQLGLVDIGNYRTLLFADIPGILEGAHQGVGLGDKFLRHIERTRVLIYVIDIAPMDNRDPVEDFHVLHKELEQYSDVLAKRDFVIAANKMDLTDSAHNLQSFREKVSAPVYPISGVTGKGIPQLLQAVAKMLYPED